jgi:hypothetical protein
MPWPSTCYQGTRATLPDGSCACASPRPPPSPTPFCRVAHAFPLRGASTQPPPPVWHGQPPRAKVHSFASRPGRCRYRCHRARAASLPSARVHAPALSCLALTRSARLRLALTRVPIKWAPCHLSTPPLLPPSSKPPLPRHASVSATPSVPSRLTRLPSSCAGPGAPQGPEAALRPAQVTSSSPVSSRVGAALVSFRITVSRPPSYELVLLAMSGGFAVHLGCSR